MFEYERSLNTREACLLGKFGEYERRVLIEYERSVFAFPSALSPYKCKRRVFYLFHNIRKYYLVSNLI